MAITIPHPAFRFAHEECATLCDKAEASEMDFDWTPVYRETVTDAETEAFINDLAEYGVYEDEIGDTKPAPSVHRAIAKQWKLDKEAVGEIIGPVFWSWAKSAAQLAKFGK